MQSLKIDQFINQVKEELLESQQEHQGKLALFKLDTVELEITIGANYAGDGKIDLKVVELGSGIEKHHTHSVKLSFRLTENPSLLTANKSTYSDFKVENTNVPFQTIQPGSPNWSNPPDSSKHSTSNPLDRYGQDDNNPPFNPLDRKW